MFILVARNNCSTVVSRCAGIRIHPGRGARREVREAGKGLQGESEGRTDWRAVERCAWTGSSSDSRVCLEPSASSVCGSFMACSWRRASRRSAEGGSAPSSRPPSAGSEPSLELGGVCRRRPHVMRARRAPTPTLRLSTSDSGAVASSQEQEQEQAQVRGGREAG